jgi:hypothetical protein
MLHPLRRSFVMVDAIVVVCVSQLSVAQKARLGASTTKIAMAVIHVAEGRRAPIMWARAHVRVMSLTSAQDTAAPLGTLLVHMVSSVLLTFTAVEPPLSLPSPAVERILIATLLGHASDGGVVEEGGTDSTTITPCRSSSVAVAGTVVVTSLVTSPYGVINMATIVCGGMCAGGGGRDCALGG